MKWLLRILLAAGALGGPLSSLGAANLSLPLEFSEPVVPWNLESLRGVPISSVVNVPPGSDGRMPTTNESFGSVNPATAKQFSAFTASGGGLGLASADWRAMSNSTYLNGSNAFSSIVAGQMHLPLGLDPGNNNALLLVQRRALIGASFLAGKVDYYFGNAINPPVTDLGGVLLTNVTPSAYWLAEPFTQNAHSNAPYYWSPHSSKAYAVQPGPITITWVRAQPCTAAERTNYVNVGGAALSPPIPNFRNNGANDYPLYTARYIVSSQPGKPPRKMYWTEGSFLATGKLIDVPATRVPAVQVAYNTRSFPEFVSSNSVVSAGTLEVYIQGLTDRTFWYDRDQKQFRARNLEGRVLVELLGEARDAYSRQSLGIEIVDVSREPAPVDVTIELGEQVLPPSPGVLADLTPEPLSHSSGESFAYQHTVTGSDRMDYYAMRETSDANDFLVHWMESGVAGLQWPSLFGRYRLVWPEDTTKYSFYLRPLVTTETEAQETSIKLATENVPVIAYQDSFDRPRAKLNEEFRFYTVLDVEHPVHRTLLRFTAGDYVGFQRVLSVLDTEVRSPASILPGWRHASPMNLDGMAGFAQLPAAPYFGGDGSFTVEAWVQLRQREAGQVLFEFGTAAVTNAVRFFLCDNSSRVPAFEIAQGGITASIAATDPLPVATWTHIAAAFDGASRYGAIYINGQEVARGLLPRPTNAVYSLNYIGRGSVAGAPYANAWVDDFRVWNTRRTSAQVLTSMQQNYPAATPGLQAQYLFNADQGASATTSPDSSGNQRGLTLYGSDLQVAQRPRYTEATVSVGDRLVAPTQEAGGSPGASYVAGYILPSAGTSFDVNAYIDPFSKGFEAANQGAIIPINAIPGKNTLEVWWFRTNAPSAGLNVGDTRKGFQPILWPAALARYTLQWPANAPEIVLASGQGSGTLSPLVATGSIYVQNDPAAPGYNPNEEHAIISGGTVYATRDDLNLTTTPYSSHPYVLVDYNAADGRPAVACFKVLREKPEAGLVFDYVVQAGQLLQPPPPLGFLGKPIVGSGASAINYNQEPIRANGDLPVGWDASRDGSGSLAHYARFTFKDRHQDFWIYRGLHSGLPALQAGAFVAEQNTFVAATRAVAILDQRFQFTLQVSRPVEALTLTAPSLPDWLSIEGMSLQGTPTAAALATNVIDLVVTDRYDQSRVTNRLVVEVQASGPILSQYPLHIPCTNADSGTVVLFTNRPPFLALSPNASNSFTMRYYYKTQPGFAWPGLVNPPAAGSIVPFLRRLDPSLKTYVGGDGASTNTTPLEIVYRPTWPVSDPKDAAQPLPTLPYGLTLAKPTQGLPGVRDMRTARVLYQQSVAKDIRQGLHSVVLHDPTRAKISSLQAQSLAQIPSGIRTEYYQGYYFFPDLPPHLADRLYVDPNRGSKGSLMFKGTFVEEALGESYLLLNVLRGDDLASVKALCPAADPERAKWIALVDALATQVETFYEQPKGSAHYIPNPSLTVSRDIGSLAEITSDNTAVDSYALSVTGPGEGYVTLLEAGGDAFTQPGDPVSMHIFRTRREIYTGELKVITSANPLSEQVTFQHSADLAGDFGSFEYEWKIAAPADGLPPVVTDPDTLAPYLGLTSGAGVPRVTIGGAGVQALGDNYVAVRYRPTNPSHPLHGTWSAWTAPTLAEGWIKRVLAGINPFNQRVTDLFNNRVNTDVSILTQAGRRWEGDIALNQSTLNNYGLIEIYETVLRRGRLLSIESGFNYGPANDALLLAAGYLNDLYMMHGNEAWADAANPTIGIGTDHTTYGDIATALFAFKGQVASLLEEELALLRGRDDVLQPGVQVSPVYNRLVWNYTRGIDSGEVIYALNYNIQEDPDANPDGVVNAADAARMYPQGHGDAYGHYLTALKGYYSLLINPNFDWVPRAETVNVLGKPVSVDYQDERKFAAAAAAVGRAGRQVFDLTWRQDYQPVHTSGWESFGETRENAQTGVTRQWGLDQWASRTGQGLFVQWVVGNAMLPDQDPNPNHEGIQKIDRTTVPELQELVSLGEDQQRAMENAEGGLSPLGLPEDSIALDINPATVVGTENGTHFEQIYSRAVGSLNNASVAFNDAKDVTRLMRSEQDSLTGFQAQVADQERSYNNSLIELYGSPYPDDMGPGKTYDQDYTGPDLVHFGYIDLAEQTFPGLLDPEQTTTITIDSEEFPAGYPDNVGSVPYWAMQNLHGSQSTNSIKITLDAHGFFKKPEAWSGRRASPGKLQEAISKIVLARNAALEALEQNKAKKFILDRNIDLFNAKLAMDDTLHEWDVAKAYAQNAIADVMFTAKMYSLWYDIYGNGLQRTMNAVVESLPKISVFGLATGGDLVSAARGAIYQSMVSARFSLDSTSFAKELITGAYKVGTESYMRLRDAETIGPLLRNYEHETMAVELDSAMADLQATVFTINRRLQELDDARSSYRALVAQGDRLLQERETYRNRAAALIQGYRTRDAAFRLFRNEKLERYKTLFDLAARYALLAANAYDYETGLLHTDQGRAFIQGIIHARALGVVRNGQPQYAGSSTGDPGLSSALAEMKADWDVLRGRLGFNNPDAYGTTTSLRTELFRILPGTDGSTHWKDVLERARMDDLLQDPDVRRYCRYIDAEDGLPVPGLVLTFSTTISPRLNLLGQPLAAGDHAFSPTAFATKIFAVGVALEGYRGMDNPPGTLPLPDSGTWQTDSLALAANPYVYLIPVGVDSMRAPPLGDAGTIRTWMVQDVAIPLPFNISASDLSTKSIWKSGDALTETLFELRKHQAFRPVASGTYFSDHLYTGNNTLQRSQYTNNRLVGRSVWNSQWKLIIPANTLLEDPFEGLDRFIRTVKDIKLHFVTYSYSGN